MERQFTPVLCLTCSRFLLGARVSFKGLVLLEALTRILLWEFFFSGTGTTERKGTTSAVHAIVMLYHFRCPRTPIPDRRCQAPQSGASGASALFRKEPRLGKAQRKAGIIGGGCQLRFPLTWMLVFPNSHLEDAFCCLARPPLHPAMGCSGHLCPVNSQTPPVATSFSPPSGFRSLDHDGTCLTARLVTCIRVSSSQTDPNHPPLPQKARSPAVKLRPSMYSLRVET